MLLHAVILVVQVALLHAAILVVTIAAVMKNVNGGSSGKTKIVVTDAINVVIAVTNLKNIEDNCYLPCFTIKGVQ